MRSYKKSCAPLPDERITHDMRIKDRADSQYLADSLGRPVQNILSIPVCTGQYSVDKPVCLFVEFSAKKPDKLLFFYESFFDINDAMSGSDVVAGSFENRHRTLDFHL